MRPPETRYRPSSRAKPACCDAFEYPVGEHVGCSRIDDLTWEVYWRGRTKVSLPR